MDTYIINGRHKLDGSIRVQGAKNSVLPILAATILNAGTSIIHNCPELRDVEAALKILRYLGCSVIRQGDTIYIDSSQLCKCTIPHSLMREMRSSVIFLGAILARTGEAVVAHPGGCELGARPIDLHLKALSTMGAEIKEYAGNVSCAAARLRGSIIDLSFPSVGATENVMISATTALGTTVLHNAAREPEIYDLQCFLNSMGAKISGAGTPVVTIDGVRSLHNTEHEVISDRIASITYLACTACAGGEILLEGTIPDHYRSVTDVFCRSGCTVTTGKDYLRFRCGGELKAVSPIVTSPYPGFPTDAQAPVMAALTKSKGITVFIENIFENRYRHVPELISMGANIRTEGRTAIVTGVSALHSASVSAADLRGGAALVAAALGAEGESIVSGLSHIDRGYEHFDENLRKLGASIYRINDTYRSEQNGTKEKAPQNAQ